MINITSATPSQIDDNMNIVTQLIYDTDPHIYPAMCGHDYALFKNTVQNYLLSADNIFSFKNIILAHEDNKVIGLLLYFDKKQKLPKLTKVPSFDNTVKRYFGTILPILNKNTIYINGVSVSEQHRRRGVATQLISYIVNRNPSKPLILDCLEENTAAISLYKRMNFKIIKNIQGFAENPEEQKIDSVRLLKM